MRSVVDEPALQKNLVDLQAGSLRVLALFTGVIGYIWLVATLWPVTGADAPVSSWLGSMALVLGVVLCYVLRESRPRLPSALFVGTTLIAVTCAVLAFQSYILAGLFFLPITFAGVLIGHGAVFLVAGLAIALSLATTHLGLGYPLPSQGVLVPVGVIVLAALAAWLAARNLYIALAWVWQGYERAHENERIAREGQAELRRVLKALDEASYRLERANYMLSLARDQAEEASRLKQQFAQTISHELRTPLNLVVGFTELMAESPEYYGAQLPAAYIRDLGIVHRNACHLQSLVNDVLDLARIEAAQMGIVPEQVLPRDLVEEAVNTARSLVESRGLALYTDVEPGLPALWVDPTRIRQVLFNLLNNAARFTEKGSITVRVCREGEDVRFAVIDTGPGIADKDKQRIFQEFQQIDGTTKRRHGGAGLGLAISRRFVELHGGRIGLESQLGHGSTFYFVLPAKRSDPIAAAGRAQEGAPAMAPATDDGRLLLVVTRSLSAVTLLARYVQGYRTVVAHDLEQAAQMAAQLIPQAVVIDSACYPLQGAEMEALARSWGLPHIPFMACALPGEQPLQQRLNVDGYLVKPVTRRSLWDALRPFGEGVDNILAIDDDRDFVRLLGRLLDSPMRRYQLLSAYTANEGLALLERRRPDLILLDLRLPDRAGLEVLERIRANPDWQDIPVIIVSAQDEADTLPAVPGTAIFSKADGLLPGELVQWVQSIVDMHVASSREEAQEEGG